MGKITSYGEDTAPTPDDFCVTVDTGSSTTKKVKISSLIKLIYPIGAIYTEITGTNPNTTFGFGTWIAFGSGRVPVGYASGDPDFGTVGATGGAKTHWHWQTVGSDGAGLYISNQGTQSGGRTHIVTDNRSTIGLNAPGVGAARYDGTEDASSLPPFIVVYMWKRTA